MSCRSPVWRQHFKLTGAHGHTPSRDCAHGASGGTTSGQSHRLHILVDGSRFAQLDQHDVVVNQPGLVVRMRDHAGSGNYLFIAIHEPTVVITEDNVHFAERVVEKLEVKQREQRTGRMTCEKVVLSVVWLFWGRCWRNTHDL